MGKEDIEDIFTHVRHNTLVRIKLVVGQWQQLHWEVDNEIKEMLFH